MPSWSGHAIASVLKGGSAPDSSRPACRIDQGMPACAMAHTDERGKLSASDVRDALTKILGRRIEIAGFARHMAAFCDADRGKTGKPKRFQYQFVDAPLQPYIIMAGKKDELI